MAQVRFQNIAKHYPGNVIAVSEIDLDIRAGELFVLVGPSGSGKTTLLRLIAGLEAPTTGSLWIGETRVNTLAPAARDVAMVFQSPALYPHLSVYGNLAFGLRARRASKSMVTSRVTEAANRLGLAALLDRAPATLSGGQRQRVALGRAMVREPRLFLLDEPFSSLDAPLRASMRAEVIDLHRKLGATMIHVTHDQAEAMAMGDRIAVMDQGRVVQVGTPAEVYHRPGTRFVAGFIGSPPMNVLRCDVEWSGERFRLRIAGTPEESAWVPARNEERPSCIDLGIRPEQITLGPGRPTTESAWNHRATVCRLEPLGHETIATVALGPQTLSLRIPPESTLQVGDMVTTTIDPLQGSWFDTESGLFIGQQ